MQIAINQQEWEKHIEGWIITGCAVLSQNTIVLCLREDVSEEEESSLYDHDIPTRMVGLMLDKEEGQRCFHLQFTGLNRSIVGVNRPIRQLLIAANNTDGQVWPYGNGKNGPYENIATGKWPSPNKLVCINDYTYAVGGFRQVYKRLDTNNWVRLANGFPANRVETEDGFNDMDAFSDNNIYAVGGNGDVWQFDGDIWHKCKFPSKERLTTVTCASDGIVYIGGERGNLWAGKDNSWQCVHKGNFYYPWNNTVWFQNRLWLISDSILQIWDGNAMLDVEYMRQPMPFSGKMDTYDGVLVIAQPEDVWKFDGEKWDCIISTYED